MKKLLLIFAVLLSAAPVSAYDFEVDGIYYNILSREDMTCEVTHNGKLSYWGLPDGSSYSDDVVIPTSVTFSGITFSVTEIGEWAFYECYKLTSVEIPNSVTTIGEHAFALCFSLKSVEIPASVTEIGRCAFSGSAGLTSFSGKFASEDNRCLIIDNVLIAFAPAGIFEYTIPASVTEIGDYAFRGCTCLTSVEIPNSVTKIGNFAFSDCESLKSVEIGNSVTEIAGSAFSGSSGVTELISLNTIPPTTEKGEFSRVSKSDCILKVPAEAGAAYKQAEGWKEFQNIVAL